MAGVATDLIYAVRGMRFPLLESRPAPVGRIEDIVLLPPMPNEAPPVVGFVVASQRRRIFVGVGRITRIDNEGAHLRSSAIDLNPFKRRKGEVLLGNDLLDLRVGNETVSDV